MAVALQVDFPNYYYNPDTGRFLSEDPDWVWWGRCKFISGMLGIILLILEIHQ